MDWISVITGALSVIVVPYGIWIAKEISQMKQELAVKMDMSKVNELIDIKQKYVDLAYLSLKEDLERLENKVDKLLERKN